MTTTKGDPTNTTAATASTPVGAVLRPTKYRHETQDGQIRERTSKRGYTYVVEAFGTAWNETEPSWGIVRWSSDYSLAVQAALRWQRQTGEKTVVRPITPPKES